MRKLVLYSIIGLFLWTACSEEEHLEPTEIKNWFEIVEKENMDAVDQKIYNIYKTHGIGVFYNDTLGYEDRGRRDSMGNVVYHYETLNLTYNMMEANNPYSPTKITWTPVNVRTEASKLKMMPVLDLLEASLLPFVKKAGIFLPAIMVTQTFRVGPTSKKVYRGFNFLQVSLADYKDDVAVKEQYCMEFISQTCVKRVEKNLDSFYEISEKMLADSCKAENKDVWRQLYYYGANEKKDTTAIFWAYGDILKNIGYLNNYTREMDSLLVLKEELDRKVDAGELTPGDAEYVNCVKGIAERTYAKENEADYRGSYAKYRPEAFGIMKLTYNENVKRYYTPTKVEDLDMYVDAVFKYSPEEFKVLYAEFPFVVGRYIRLNAIFVEAGFDMDELRNYEFFL